MLRLQPYDFRVVHIPGRDNIADPLSRLFRKGVIEVTHEHGAEEYVKFVATNATPKTLTTREVEVASATDEELRELRCAVESDCYDKCQAYAPTAYELCMLVSAKGDKDYFTTLTESQGTGT